MSRRIVLVDIGSGLTLSGVLPSIALHGSYSAKLIARGGVAPYTFTTGSHLPDGLTLDRATGLLAADDVAEAGTFALVVTVTDLSGASVTREFTLQVVPQPLTISGTYPDGVTGTAYSADIEISGGVPPYGNPTVISGAIPDGLSFSIVGSQLRLSGIPLIADAFDAVINVEDDVATHAAHHITCSITEELTYAKAVLDLSPDYYLKCDDASGNLADSTGNNRPGVIIAGALTYGAPSIRHGHKTSVYLSNDEKIATSGVHGKYPDSGWFSAWFLPDFDASYGPINQTVGQALLFVGGGGDGVSFSIYASFVSGGFCIGNSFKVNSSAWSQLETAADIDPSTPHHLLVNWSNTRQAIYIDGALKASNTLARAGDSHDYSSEAISRATFKNADSYPGWRGWMQDIAVGVGNLTESQVADLYADATRP